jgi:hypothetical protein
LTEQRDLFAIVSKSLLNRQRLVDLGFAHPPLFDGDLTKEATITVWGGHDSSLLSITRGTLKIIDLTKP